MTDDDKLIEKTAEIVAAYVGNNQIDQHDVAALVRRVRGALAGPRLGEGDIPLNRGLTRGETETETDGEPIVQRIRHKMESVHEKPIRAPEFQRPADSPAVPIDESVTHDYIICLEDGHKTKLLKRYIRTKFDMTPEEYKTKWKLPADYPFTAPEYSQRRADIASNTGLGKND